MIKAVFFDLFFTLIVPHYAQTNEYDVIGISAMEWERYAEDRTLYYERAIGSVTEEKEIIDRIIDSMPYEVTQSQRQEVLQRRQDRMKRALLSVDCEIINTLQKLKNEGIKIGLISNADKIDKKYWTESSLAEFFDVVIFSCDVGKLKPDVEIYQLAMERMGIIPQESIFVGDGGSNELYGAKTAGMKTIFSEYLEQKPFEKAKAIQEYADYHVKIFREILDYIK